jgi:hypothetical protein
VGTDTAEEAGFSEEAGGITAQPQPSARLRVTHRAALPRRETVFFMGSLLLKQYKKQCKMQMLLSGMKKRTRKKFPVQL